MESIGEKLRSARVAKKLNIKDTAKQTNINPIYLNALEDEEFDKFPSETYLIGFLKLYSEFLKLDVDEMVQAYKGYKIGESATPLEELTKSTRPSIAMIASSLINNHRNIVFAVLVALVVVVLYWSISWLMSSKVDIQGDDSVVKIQNQYTARSKESKIENIRNLQLQNNRGFILVYKSEAVQFMVDNKEVIFILKEVTPKSVTMEFLPQKQNETLEIDVPRPVVIAGSPREVVFTLKGLTENRAKIFVMLDKKSEQAVTDKAEETTREGGTESVDVVAQNKKNLKIIFEAEFKEKSFIEIYLDGTMKKRGFIAKGKKERWEAAEYIQLKMGNAGGIDVKINGKDYSFGKMGQVANKVITWKKDVKDPNLYHIVVNDW